MWGDTNFAWNDTNSGWGNFNTIDDDMEKKIS